MVVIGIVSVVCIRGAGALLVVGSVFDMVRVGVDSYEHVSKPTPLTFIYFGIV